MESAKRVAILYICTGKYVAFWKSFYKSARKNLLRDCKKVFFVFTDATSIHGMNNSDVNLIFQENLGWPGNTLKRFSIFQKIKNDLKNFDYIYFFNANSLFCKEIKEEEFLPGAAELVVVKHPGYYNCNSSEYPYERNNASLACIPYGEGEYYVCGGVNGGKSKAYIKLIDELSGAIDQDLANNIIAKWHDESHINKYVHEVLKVDQNRVRILSPEYCYPQGWDMPFEKKIIIKEKSLYIDVHSIKNSNDNRTSLLVYMRIAIRRLVFNLRLFRRHIHG